MGTVRSLIEQLGGVRAAARKLDIPVSTVSNWNTNDAMPAWRWSQVKEKLAELPEGGAQ